MGIFLKKLALLAVAFPLLLTSCRAAADNILTYQSGIKTVSLECTSPSEFALCIDPAAKTVTVTAPERTRGLVISLGENGGYISIDDFRIPAEKNHLTSVSLWLLAFNLTEEDLFKVSLAEHGGEKLTSAVFLRDGYEFTFMYGKDGLPLSLDISGNSVNLSAKITDIQK